MIKREKKILVLSRRDQTEAMRVAAGLTIFGHGVRLVIMDRELADTPENRVQAELLELSDIAPETTISGTDLPYLTSGALAEAMVESDVVLSI